MSKTQWNAAECSTEPPVPLLLGAVSSAEALIQRSCSDSCSTAVAAQQGCPVLVIHHRLSASALPWSIATLQIKAWNPNQLQRGSNEHFWSQSWFPFHAELIFRGEAICKSESSPPIFPHSKARRSVILKPTSGLSLLIRLPGTAL